MIYLRDNTLFKHIILTLVVFFWMACEDSHSDHNTIYNFDLHPAGRVSSLKMNESEYENYISNDGFSDPAIRIPIIQDIYERFPDKYDFIFFVLNESSIPASLNYYGKLIGVSNDIEGIGLSKYDYSSEYGSSGKLKAIMQLTGLEYLKYGPALHEIAHQWANFALLTHSVDAQGQNISSFPYGSHWGFTGGSSPGQLGGFDQNTLVENGNSSYTVDAFGPFANGGNGVPYNELELYLMGMLPLSSVSSFDVFTNITSLTINQSTWDFTAETRTTYGPVTLENAIGERVPSFTDSQKDFKLLLIVITDDNLSDDEWSRVDATAEWFSKNGDDGTSLFNFWEATNGVGSITIEN